MGFPGRCPAGGVPWRGHRNWSSLRGPPEWAPGAVKWRVFPGGGPLERSLDRVPRGFQIMESPGECPLERIIWRLCHGRNPLVGVSWKGFSGGCRLYDIRRRGFPEWVHLKMVPFKGPLKGGSHQKTSSGPTPEDPFRKTPLGFPSEGTLHGTPRKSLHGTIVKEPLPGDPHMWTPTSQILGPRQRSPVGEFPRPPM